MKLSTVCWLELESWFVNGRLEYEIIPFLYSQVQSNVTAHQILSAPDVITSIKSLTSTINHTKVSQSDCSYPVF